MLFMALLMTLSWRFLPILYTRTREGEVPQLGSGPTPCRLGLAVRKCLQGRKEHDKESQQIIKFTRKEYYATEHTKPKTDKPNESDEPDKSSGLAKSCERAGSHHNARTHEPSRVGPVHPGLH